MKVLKSFLVTTSIGLTCTLFSFNCLAGVKTTGVKARSPQEVVHMKTDVEIINNTPDYITFANVKRYNAKTTGIRNGDTDGDPVYTFHAKPLLEGEDYSATMLVKVSHSLTPVCKLTFVPSHTSLRDEPLVTNYDNPRHYACGSNFPGTVGAHGNVEFAVNQPPGVKNKFHIGHHITTHGQIHTRR